MSVGSVIRGVASGVGKVVTPVVKDLREVVAGTPEPAAPDPSFPNQQVTPQPFSLPTLDSNDPDFEEKKAVHDAYGKLASLHDEHARTAGDEYGKKFEELSSYVRSKPQARRFSPLSMFAIAMGNPDAMKNVEAHNKGVEDESSKREEYLLNLKETALKGNLQKLLEEGNFKQALTQSAVLADLNATKSRIESKRKSDAELEQIKEQNKGKQAVAQIRADAAIASADRRVGAYAQSLGLAKSQIKAVTDMMRAMVAAGATQKDIMGQPMLGMDAYHQMEDTAYEMIDKIVEEIKGAPATPPAAPAGATPVKPAAAGQSQLSPRAAAVLAARNRTKAATPTK